VIPAYKKGTRLDRQGLDNRRPLAIRQRAWVGKAAQFLVRQGVSPNQVSSASIIFAAFGASAYAGSSLTGGLAKAGLLLVAAALIQLRLLCNLLDGVMAVEGGKQTPVGPLYNELPDRLADSFFLIAAGYAAGFGALGWVAALLAAMTAYVRALGGSLGAKQDFCGPMAKPHRMHALFAGSILAALLPVLPILAGTLSVIILGTAVTIFRRVRRLANLLAGKPDVCTGSGG
jgi:phosphatidylglycerophosphate synthase